MPARALKVDLNPALLVWARKTAGYNLARLAELLKKPQDKLESWESGAESPSITELEAYAKKVKRPLSVFFLPKPPLEPDLPKDFRILSSKEPGTFNPETLLAFRKARALASDARDLADLLDFKIESLLPRFEQKEDVLNEQAKNLRKLLGISIKDQLDLPSVYAALDTWRDRLFQVGVFVFQFPISVEDARGFSLEDNGIGIIGLSSKDAAVARCFSVFHEVCHLCIGKPGVSADGTEGLRRLQSPVERVEAFCDRFSAAFLVPTDVDTVKDILQNTFSDKARLDPHPATRSADKLKVSKYVLLRRALDADYIKRDLYWETFSAWRAIDKQVEKPKPPIVNPIRKQISARGKWFASLVFEALDAERISSHEAGEYLNMQPQFLDKARDCLIGNR